MLEWNKNIIVKKSVVKLISTRRMTTTMVMIYSETIKSKLFLFHTELRASHTDFLILYKRNIDF